MSEIRENLSPREPGDQGSIEIEVDAVEPKLEVSQAISENPTRLVGMRDLGPQLPNTTFDHSLDPTIASNMVPDSEISEAVEASDETAEAPDEKETPTEAIAEPVAEINSGQIQTPETKTEPVVVPEPTMTPKSVEPAEKYHQVMEAMYKAPDLNALLAAFQEMSDKNGSGEMGLVRIQEAMAENLARIGHPEKAIDFTLLAGQTANNSHFENSVKQLTELLDRTLPYNISRLLEGLQEQNRQSQNRN